MKIRRAKIEDATTIAQINVDTWHNAYKGLIDDAILKARVVDEKRIAAWEETIKNPNRIVLVCENNKEVVGYLTAGPARDDCGFENELFALYVKPSSQNQGIGSALINEYKKIIKNRPFYLYMLKNNQKAAGFYEKNGGVICKKFNRNLEVQGHTFEEVCYVFEGVSAAIDT